jgi:hypothetical protein
MSIRKNSKVWIKRGGERVLNVMVLAMALAMLALVVVNVCKILK